MKKKGAVLAAMAALTASLSFMGTTGIMAYLTDIGPTFGNNFTIALDSKTTVVEKYPDFEPGNDFANYEKTIQVANVGYIDCYVRVRLDFSDSDVESKTTFSWDGTNYYSVADYKNHLPQGWTYNSSDGYYYYTPILYAEGWDDCKTHLLQDTSRPDNPGSDGHGEWYYPPTGNIVGPNDYRCITTPLVRYVKTKFASPADARTYSLYVSEESVPFYFGNDYNQAWQNYRIGISE